MAKTSLFRNQRRLLLFFVCFSVLANGSKQRTGSPYVGYGWSNAVLSTKFQEESYIAFEEGFRHALGTQFNSSLLVNDHDASGSKLAAIKVFEDLLKKDVIMVTGFPSSHESLLIAQAVQKAKVFFISVTASHSDLGKFGPTVYTSAQSILTDVTCLMDHIKTSKMGKRGLIIVNQRAVWSAGHETIIKELNLKEPYGLDLDYAYVTSDLAMDASYLKKLGEKQYDFIFPTTYSVESLRIMGQINSIKPGIPVIGNGNWLGTNLEALKKEVERYTGPIYSCTSVVKENPVYKAFIARMSGPYGKSINEDSALSFDAGVIVGQLLKRVMPKTPTREAVLQEFQKNPCFENTSVGKLCFPPAGGHALRESRVVVYRNGDFVYL